MIPFGNNDNSKLKYGPRILRRHIYGHICWHNQLTHRTNGTKYEEAEKSWSSCIGYYKWISVYENEDENLLIEPILVKYTDAFMYHAASMKSMKSILPLSSAFLLLFIHTLMLSLDKWLEQNLLGIIHKKHTKLPMDTHLGSKHGKGEYVW